MINFNIYCCVKALSYSTNYTHTHTHGIVYKMEMFV